MMMMNKNKDKRYVVQKLQSYRLVIQPSAMEHLLTKLYTTTEGGNSGTYLPFEETLERFIKKQLTTSDTTITVSHIDSFFSQILQSGSGGHSSALDSSQKQVQLLRETFDISSVNLSAQKFSQAKQLINTQIQRTKLIRDWCQKNNLLSSLPLIPVNALISSKGSHYLFGTITQKIHDRSLYLEDTTGIVKLNLDNCDKLGEGIFCAGMSVLINGEWDQVTESVNVSAMILPPMIVNDNVGNWKILPDETSRVVILKDLFLDQVGVLEKLYTLFHYLTVQDPKQDTLVLLLGSFVSPEFKAANPTNLSLYKDLFAELVPLLNHFSTLKIRFISGHRDFCPGNFIGILPRAEISIQVRDLFAQMKHVKFCTDPCNGIWWNKVSVKVCADLDLGTRLSRNNIFRTSNPEKEKIQNDSEWIRAWRTIIRQRHLTPFELNVQPVFWQLDSLLSLFSFLDEGSKNETKKVLIVGDNRRDWRGNADVVDGVLVVCAPSWYHNDQCMIWDSNGIQTQTILTAMTD